ncbi:amidase domain-containing protein [Streptomyces sp. NPDC004539]|uniref:amidase domain-containing protein n=1 Tax=Streptomyces sp. NPDC004539 TaxID=3154280 RepID=UPI0033A79D83
MSRSRRRVTILTATAASVAAGVALLPNWSAGAATPSNPTVDAKTRATFQKLADAVFTDRTDALVDGNRKKPTTKGFSGRVKMSSKQNSAESSTLSTLTQRKTTLAKAGEKYSKGATSVSLDTVKVTGRTAKAKVTETTTLSYEKVTGKEPTTTGFQAHHELTFSADSSGNWQLSGVRSTDDGGPTVNQVAKPAVATVKPAAAATDTPAAPRAATTRNPVAVPKTLTGGTYDYKAMAAYAEKYWSNYNPDYPNFNGQGAGGDCTNFVSQSLKAGGWKHAPGYVYDYTKWFGNNEIQSYSFVGVNEWSWFTQNAKRSTPLANVYQMQVGDVLQVDFDRDGSKDHTMIVSYVSGGMPYLTYHSSNTYRRSLSSILSSYPNSYYYAYRT